MAGIHTFAFVMAEEKRALLLLADGRTMEGRLLGVEKVVCGELCFTTAMSGYQETYTDPSYYGQLLISTATHIGNYGTCDTENESATLQPKGIVVQRCATHASRKAATHTLDAYLARHTCIGIADIDTRALVHEVRRQINQHALIAPLGLPLDSLKVQLKESMSQEDKDLSLRVTTKKPYAFAPTKGKARARVAVLDFGIKQAILDAFIERKIEGKVFPADTSTKTLMAYDAEGYFLSNGPGDPMTMDARLPMVRALMKTGKPLFGICLGHQLVARACGATTYKLPFGHRGLNHPILDIKKNKAFMSVQNHGFAVDADSLAQIKDIELTHRHLNDQSVAGLALRNAPVFTVQFHPEASPGPREAGYLFDKFVHMLSS